MVKLLDIKGSICVNFILNLGSESLYNKRKIYGRVYPDVIKSRHRAARTEKWVQYSGLAHNAFLFVPFVPIIFNQIVQMKYNCIHCPTPYNKTSMYKGVLKLKKEARRGNE